MDTQRIEVQSEWFFDLTEGKDLLECFRNSDMSFIKEQLDTALKIIEEKTRQEEPQKRRKAWRGDRVKLYDNLLLVALGVEGDDRKKWENDQETVDLWHKKFEEKFVQGSIYKYLLDHIHENDDIMLKYYHVKKDLKDCVKEAIWLKGSMEMFRVDLVNSTIDILMDWDVENEARGKFLLMKAKKEFKAKLEKLKISSWRYKARAYWMLARAKHAYMKEGQAKFKSFKFMGPVGVLLQEIITEDYEILVKSDEDSLIDQIPKKKYVDKQKEDVLLGTWKSSSMLAYASAVNDHVLVTCMLKSREEFIKSFDCDDKWEDAWKKAWANALWIAAYKGHGPIVKELILQCSELYSSEHYRESMRPPLHVAVHRGHFLVVDAFCTESKSNLISCHEEDHLDGQTPLEVATNSLKDNPAIKKKIQGILLQRPEVKQAVEESYRQRELTVGSANAIMVGAALIAGVTYAGWLQPPLGYHNYYQFTEPVPGAPDAPLSYLFVQGHKTIRVFAIFNSLSFFFAIAAIVAGMDTYCYIGDLEETYITKTVERLRYQLKRTRILFIASVLFVLIAFSSAAIAILPPIKRYQRDMYITIGLGGFICLVLIGRTLLRISKVRIYEGIRSQLAHIKVKSRDTLR